MVSQFTYSGVGFVFTEESGIIVIDIDHCVSNGILNEVVAAILAKWPPTYIEVSPSGTGLHIFMRGKLPTGGRGTIDLVLRCTVQAGISRWRAIAT